MAYTTINKGSSYFNTVLWTGNGATSRSLTGVGFKPDFLWVKCRNQGSFSHTLSDAVRGSTKTLFSNLTNAEINNYTYGYVTSYDTDGFSATAGASSIEQYNSNADTYVGWNWLASNTTAVTNTQGTITSTVSANTTSGFSIVGYTGTGANATVGHGLGVAPQMMVVKNRSAVSQWEVYHVNTGNTSAMQLSGTGTPDVSSTYWNDTTPTSTLFSIGTGTPTNGSGNSIIAYCFAEVKGFSQFGSFVGNGSTNGTYIYTGFKPAFIMTKQSSGAGGNWFILDNKRNPYNVANTILDANLSDAERTATIYNFYSNGFKFRLGSSETFIYMAFAENPFVTSGGIPVTAR